MDGIENACGEAPLILLKNRTGQVVSTGRDLAEFWCTVEKHGVELAERLGVVLDVQQLFTQTPGGWRTLAGSSPA